jgi:hypothetical protein
MYQPYSYSPITRRGAFRLPDGFDLAFYSADPHLTPGMSSGAAGKFAGVP